MAPSGKESAQQMQGSSLNSDPGKIPYATEQLSPLATTTEPVLQNQELQPVSMPQLLKLSALSLWSTIRAAIRSLCNPMKSRPRLLQERNAQVANKDPGTAKK